MHGSKKEFTFGTGHMSFKYYLLSQRKSQDIVAPPLVEEKILQQVLVQPALNQLHKVHTETVFRCNDTLNIMMSDVNLQYKIQICAALKGSQLEALICL